MKKNSWVARLRATAFVLAVCSARVFGAIVLGPGGVGPQTFDTLPSAQDWSTLGLAGSAADIHTLEEVHATIQQLNATSINQQLGSASSLPPTTNGIARWNTTGKFLQSRPTSTRATLLMARIQNACGTNATGLRIGFDFAVYEQLAGELPGFQVYYSLTGSAGTWQNVAALSGVNASGFLTTTVPLFTPWTNGTALFLLFADDNAENITDPAYTIDNFSVGAVVPGEPFQPSLAPAVAISWLSETSHVYQPQWAGVVPTNQWNALGPYRLGIQGTNFVYDAPTNDARFYRVTVLK